MPSLMAAMACGGICSMARNDGVSNTCKTGVQGAFNRADSVSSADKCFAWFAAISLRVDTVHLLMTERHSKGWLTRQKFIVLTPSERYIASREPYSAP
ncbi:hypothetical protein, partial [Pseudomonas viridiflava]|uniref:hypothetical protein n=1 Tax=Pseudomonas viridiflava TaxID=33069 RepID=UPI00197DB6A1